MSPLYLVLLALLDGALLGFRSAAGRSGLLEKRPLYRRAILLGLASSALLALGGVLLAGLLCVLKGPALWSSFELAAAASVRVFALFASLVLAALALWSLPHSDLRTLATVSVLGPGTLARPAVVLLGMLYGWRQNPRWEVALLAVYGTVGMLSLEPLLTRFFFPVDPSLLTPDDDARTH